MVAGVVVTVINRVSLFFLTFFMILEIEANSSSKTRTIDRLQYIGSSLLIFRLDNYDYPCGENGLQGLEFNQNNLNTWKGPYLRKHHVDGWGQEFVYVYKCSSNEKIYKLYSIGENKVDERGKGDDILYQQKFKW